MYYNTTDCSGDAVLGVWDSTILSIDCLPQNESFSLRGGTVLRVRGSLRVPQWTAPANTYAAHRVGTTSPPPQLPVS